MPVKKFSSSETFMKGAPKFASPKTDRLLVSEYKKIEETKRASVAVNQRVLIFLWYETKEESFLFTMITEKLKRDTFL